MKAWLQLGVMAVVTAGLLATKSAAGTSDVYRIQTLIHGVSQWDLNSNPGTPRAQASQLRDVDLINLGLGRALTNIVHDNERLALVTQCANNNMRIIVYDKTTQSNLVTIGYLKAVSVIESLRGKRYTRNVISELILNFTNANPSNELTGGIFFAAGSILSDSNQCLVSYHANLIGALGSSFFFTNAVVTNVVDITVTNTITNTYYAVSNFTVNVSSTVLTAGGKKLGTLIEP